MTFRPIFILTLTAGWFVLCMQWYCCWMGDGCPNCAPEFSAFEPLEEVKQAENPSLNKAPSTKEYKYPISFRWSSARPLLSDQYSLYKDAISESYNDDQLLEIVGYYFSDEPEPSDYPDMGIARANAVMDLFKDRVHPDHILIKSEIANKEKKDVLEEFPGVSFKWISR